MNNKFYLKLAFTNLIKNRKVYVPYLLTCIITTTMFYIIKSLSTNNGLKDVWGNEPVTTVLILGVYIVGIFCVIFLFYTNNFLIRRRKKEFGLFNILGMEKNHISKVIFFETLITFIVSFFIALGLGIVLDKLMFLILLKLFDESVKLGFHISVGAFKSTFILFFVINALIFLNSIRQINLVNVIELLNSEKYGEKEQKIKWFTTILGFICLFSGYYISITTENVIQALQLFFIAVLLVIFGTYLLFISGITTILKLLKKNKNYYYKTNNFISLSSLIYRMKQNAVGLSNICILSTMVLVTISSTFSMWIGIDDLLKGRFPYEITMTYSKSDIEDEQKILSEIENSLNKLNIEKEDFIKYDSIDFLVSKDGNNFNIDYRNVTLENKYIFRVIDIEDYNNISNQNKSLEKDEILINSSDKNINLEELNILGYNFKVKENIETIFEKENITSTTFNNITIVVENENILQNMVNKMNENNDTFPEKVKTLVSFDTTGNKEQNIQLFEDLYEVFFDSKEIFIECRSSNKKSFNQLYGSFLFIGLFLSVLFIIATILIIYYKQITEGYEDKNRYEIMQKVGMDYKNVKNVINKQILTVFFLPLIIAGIHIIFAFPIIKRILSLMYLTNINLFIISSIGCYIIYSLIYIIIYYFTSKIYYSIVKRN